MRHCEHISALTKNKRRLLMRSRAAFRMRAREEKGARTNAAARCDQIIHRPGALLFIWQPVRSNK